MSVQKFKDNNILVLIATVSCVWGGVACNQFKRSADGTGSYLHTTIDGMESGDESLEGIRYEILCDDNPDKRIQGSTDKNNPRHVTFPENEFKIGAKCALEITADAKEKQGVGIYEWKARRKDNTPYIGLFYSSNYATVELNKEEGKTQKFLAFTVIKTYGILYNDPFIARIPINFDKEDGANIPTSGLLASMECSSPSSGHSLFYESSTDAKLGAIGDQRVFDFRLSAHKMKDAKCSRITVAIENVVLYEGKMNHVNFTNPQVNSNPETDKNLLFDPVTVASNQETFGIIDCDQRNPAGQCTSIKINQGAEVWFAIVTIEQSGVERDYVVTPGFGLMVDSNTGSKTIHDISLHINQTVPDTFKYFDYSQTLGTLIGHSDNTSAILKYPYTNATAEMIKSYEITSSSLQGSTPKYFKAAFAHGFRTVSEGYLNSLPGGRWFAKTKLISEAQVLGDVLIAGGKKYFETVNNLRPASAQKAFLTREEYQKDNTPSDARYRTYTYKGGGWAESCGLSLDYFRLSMGHKTQDQLGIADTQADACELKDQAKLDQLRANNLIFLPRYYLWGWHSFHFE